METPGPQTIESLVDPNARYSVAALRAARQLARTKPWRGTFDKRWADFQACHAAMVSAYITRVRGLRIEHRGTRYGCSGGSFYDARRRIIVLTGRLSVVTMFQLFAYALEMSQPEAQRWAATLFKRKFPISFSRCRLVGGLLVNSGRRDD